MKGRIVLQKICRVALYCDRLHRASQLQVDLHIDRKRRAEIHVLCKRCKPGSGDRQVVRIEGNVLNVEGTRVIRRCGALKLTDWIADLDRRTGNDGASWIHDGTRNGSITSGLRVDCTSEQNSEKKHGCSAADVRTQVVLECCRCCLNRSHCNPSPGTMANVNEGMPAHTSGC